MPIWLSKGHGNDLVGVAPGAVAWLAWVCLGQEHSHQAEMASSKSSLQSLQVEVQSARGPQSTQTGRGMGAGGMTTAASLALLLLKDWLKSPSPLPVLSESLSR